MSGGFFDYNQQRIQYIIEDIQQLIDENNYRASETIEFKKAIELLQQAHVYTQRIDWFVSGDDDEEDFHQRLKENLTKIKETDA